MNFKYLSAEQIPSISLLCLNARHRYCENKRKKCKCKCHNVGVSILCKKN